MGTAEVAELNLHALTQSSLSRLLNGFAFITGQHLAQLLIDALLLSILPAR